MLIINIGLPGSGKSTLLEQLKLSQEHFFVISRDQIRDQWFGVIYEPKIEKQVWSINVALVEGHLRLGKHVYIDGTNLTATSRQQWVELGNQYGQTIVFVYFDVPFEQVHRQNQRRDSKWVVPDDVLLDMHASLELPQEEERYDHLLTVTDSYDPQQLQMVQQEIENLTEQHVAMTE